MSGGSGQSGEMTIDELVDKLLDEHLSTDENDAENNDGDGSGPTASGPAKLTKEDRQQLKADLKDQIVALSKTCEAGNLPAGVQRIIQELVSPKMNWRELIQSQLDSLMPIDYSFQRCNRHGFHLGAILPGSVNDKKLSVAAFIDMSGSIGEKQAQEFLSEINGIMQQYQSYEILVGCFDTQVYNVQTFSSDNGEDIRTYRPTGGGGTNAACIVEYLKENGMTPLKLVVFTDGYVGDWGDPNYTDTLWIISGSDIEPPFGQFANYDDEKNK
jgi:predicted metal-dependent peptidase